MTDAVEPGREEESAAGPAIDPTKNVLDLVGAAITRQDDLRGAGASLFHALLEGLQRYIDTKIDGHIRLSNERYEGVQREFQSIEARRIEHKGDTKSAVDAAFSAAKEAVKEQAASSDKAILKSEGTVGGQIKAVEGTVDDLKDRVGKLETQQQTKTEVRSDNRSNTAMIAALVGVALSFLMLATVIAIAALRQGG